MSNKKTHIVKLSWVRKKIVDPFNPNAYLNLEIFVPKPTKENPLPCLLVSIRNGHTKLFFRLRDVVDYSKSLSLSRRDKEKLRLGLIQANVEADEIEKDMRLSFARRRLLPGDKIVNTGSGEILAEAERMLNNK